jgi:integrase
LGAHASGSWCKKIRGKIHYFGKWGVVRDGKLERLPYEPGWQAALAKYELERDALHSGRTPRSKRGELSIGDLRDRFLTAKSRALDASEITTRTYFEYKATVGRLIAQFGVDRLVDDLTADDFATLRAELAKTCGPVRLGNEIQKLRSIFKYGYESGLIDKPVRFGTEFKKPSASVLRRHRAANGKKLFEAAELHSLISGAPAQLKAMILLGLNCGFGNHDCATLPFTAVDLDAGWIDYPRPKNGIERRCPLWPETIGALKAAIAERPKSKDEESAKLVFLTTRGRPWLSREIANPISVAVRDLMKSVKVHRAGLGFYTLRHTFRTIADAVRDLPAVRLIMGHTDGSIDAVYREQIDASRLQAVTDHVRRWLFGAVDKPTDAKPQGEANAKRQPRPPQKKENAISGRMPPVVVEYDGKDGRVSKRFEDAFAGRRFYAAKDKTGKHPKVLSADRPALRIVG